MQEFEPAERAGQERSTRRLFLTGVAMCGVAFVGALVGVVRFLMPNVDYGEPRKIRIGKPSDFPDKSVTYLEDSKVFIVRDGKAFRALSAVCTHLGCTVRANAGGDGFLCPCHGSKFLADGTNSTGPAPKPLEAFEISVDESGLLVVDKDTLVSRTEAFHI